MKHRKIVELLPEYCEGTLDAEERRSVGEHLAGCAECRQSSELIALGFSELLKEESLAIPVHYFNNFIPRLRERIDAHQKRRSRIFLPSWLEPMLAPFSTLGILAGVAGLFFLLRTLPAGSDTSLQGLLAQISPEELVRLVDQEMTISEPLLHQPIMETASNAALVSGHLESQWIAAESSVEDVVFTPAAGLDVPEVELLSEEEVTNVINHLNQSRTL